MKSPNLTLEQIPILILAGGLGTRLRSVVTDLPKGLVNIADKPFLEIQIDLLKRQGARNFILCLGYMNEKVQDHFWDGSSLGVDIRYSIESEGLLGTAGAVRNAAHLFDGPAMVLNGDTYFDIDYPDLLESYYELRQSIEAKGIIALSKAENENQFGTVKFKADSLQLLGFHEKVSEESTGWVNAGAYILEKILVEQYCPPQVPCSIEKEFFPSVINANEALGVYLSENAFYDIGTPESLNAFITFYLEKLHGTD